MQVIDSSAKPAKMAVHVTHRCACESNTSGTRLLVAIDHFRGIVRALLPHGFTAQCVGSTNAVRAIVLASAERIATPADANARPRIRRSLHNQCLSAEYPQRIQTGIPLAPFAAAIL